MPVIYTRCLTPQREDRLSLVATVWSGPDYVTLGKGTEDTVFMNTTTDDKLHYPHFTVLHVSLLLQGG